ncbi:MAG: hypothetical protein AMXMBFR7_36800 [Planctomycetota bacterium]
MPYFHELVQRYCDNMDWLEENLTPDEMACVEAVVSTFLFFVGFVPFYLLFRCISPH